jgi:hypothetical protein
MSTATNPRMPSGRDLMLGVAGGLVAGSLMGIANGWFATSLGQPANTPLKMAATVFQGDDVLAKGDANIWIGLLAHLLLSAVFGAVFVLIVRLLPGNRSSGNMVGYGVAFGAVVFLVNFKLMAPWAFSTFEAANEPFQLVVHVVYGAVLATALLGFSLAGATPMPAGDRVERTPAPDTGSAAAAAG